VTLNVAIGKLKQAGTIGEYISGLYTWLLYATALLAVIMIMIGGVQYAMAAGKQGAIGQAKKRIVDAVIGLILVFCAALIGALIDPNLVTFRQIGVPKIKTVTFIPDDASCDYLDEKGFTVSATEGQECGKPGRVTELSTDPTVGDTTIELNHECTWMGCEEDFEACVAIADGDEDFGCVRCADSWDYYEGGTYEKGVTPVPSNCERLTPDDDVIDGNEKNGDYGYCEYTAGFSLLGVDFGRACVEFYYPPSKAEVVGGGDIGVDCEVLRQDARNAGSESCRAYDNVFVRYANRLQYEFTSVDNFQDQKGEYLVKRICEDDPCGFGQETAQAANKSVNCKYFDPFTATPGFYDTICTVPGLGHLPGCLWLQESTAPVGCYDSEYVSNYMADYATLSTIFSGESEDSYAEQISEAASILSTNPVCLDVNGNQTYAICKSTW